MSGSQQQSVTAPKEPMDPAVMAVIANRLEAIVREMTSTLLRAGRSAVINVARDFSCSIVTGDDELIASAEGLPVHIFGSHVQSAEMRRRHPDLREGDAILDNDPYVGNTHHADHTILVPVFVEGEHLFTAVAKAHQADCGNGQPTTYSALATDVYDEGALNFPVVRVQRDFRDIDDVIRMCRRRIRVPEQWYGDYLATLGSARTGERRLKELVSKYGIPTIRQFIDEWFDYSERRMAHALRQIPTGRYERETTHDPVAHVPAIPLKVVLDVDGDAGRVRVDLRDNPDCVDAGINLSRTTSINSALTGLFNAIDPTVPHNSGSFRRVDVQLREGGVVGVPKHPVSCSVATTNVADRVINMTQAALEGAGPESGLAEGAIGMGVTYAVISGTDARNGEPFVNQLVVGNNGGPASATTDGWTTFTLPVTGGLLYRDSVEIDEQKYPVLFDRVRLVPDSGGAGAQRGGLAGEVVYGAVGGPLTAVYLRDCHEFPAKGIHGGHAGGASQSYLIGADGERSELPGVHAIVIQPGERLHGIDAGGGGFGDPRERDPALVLDDVLEGWVSREAAERVYGVAFVGDDPADLQVDIEATDALRRG